MSRITKEQIEHVAHLARLSFTDEELNEFTDTLGQIIEFAEQLNEVDTDGVEPTSHATEVHNVLREDETKPSPARENSMRNAPDQENGQYKVPSVLE
ncbi:Asp-tRNA(Asn)/Glu-tRNA(Gln) amidotransferase subunit GatC [Salisediminibacterium halotolerans]|uniref:Aspartyl/glutamyl-tRNA(Asn/Gln) amidotransferase subunit C n=1 Tax=Salisediminibacterium halotolerans TaxID=517425 RepID=A0A1H9VVZ0_9BACI|nr:MULTISPECIES: Asp-tRNA(Asn)/Glu-tRNA(Gln) amidotransferase subunit GatC [Salisediminibacterium]RLJ71779.1 aspartyl/glutamyl-tRNA(Asn/Gln) amidotransferase subunit C [Actinophytocola xinjiangensis]RPE86929.1 aspartyl/glutamyl-tRNA(Asn/Gln) amidotransferase subunit C [Salisediminibacterium halotolerans]TWG32992.1 aspartyl/glutamyl-tRNA(Asn/Gln) amidotransferase subunit C [Salisediminibacterium halotolerans]SES25691.1 aspartyl-tRNA(Asn)/glutamyl-tRNA(Gln) amidotransferase subunit C [Salisedimin